MVMAEYTEEYKGEAIIVFKFKDADTESYFKGITLNKTRTPFKAEKGETCLLTGGRNVIIAGLGDAKGITVNRLIEAVQSAVWRARDEGFESAGIIIDNLVKNSCSRITEAAVIAARSFDKYFMRRKKDLRKIKKIYIIGPEEYRKEFEKSLIIANAVNEARDLQDTAPEELYPESFAKITRVMAKNHNIKFELYDEKSLKKMGYNAILAVGRGSKRPPRMVVLDYKPRGYKKTVCLVGKGITFDSGGYNLKPTASMADMKHDMSGAAVVYGVIKAASALKLKTRIIGIMGLAENLIGGSAYKPSDIIMTASGISVEIGNTDAEGRLVLADALHHANSIKPNYTIDFATLTGACIVALGSVAGAILGTDNNLINELIKSGLKTGERLWELPLYEEYEEDISSKIADIKNIGYKREAGTITAAQFLKQFVKGKWAHIDIAGTAMVERPRFMTEHGGTGFGVRLMIDWLSQELKGESENP